MIGDEKNVKSLKNKRMAVCHDLTSLNQEILQSIRLKYYNNEIEDVWYYNGKIYVKRKI